MQRSSTWFSLTLAAGKVVYIIFLCQPLTKEVDEYILLVREMLESVVYCRSRNLPNAMATSTLYLGHKYFHHIFCHELLKLIEFGYIKKGEDENKRTHNTILMAPAIEKIIPLSIPWHPKLAGFESKQFYLRDNWVSTSSNQWNLKITLVSLRIPI